MRVYRVYFPQLMTHAEADDIKLSDVKLPDVKLQGREAHHLLHVLRVQVGQQLRVFDGQGHEAEAVIKRADDVMVTLEVGSPQVSQVESGWRLHAAVGLLKGDKLADVVRQLTELGVMHVQPFISRFGDVPKVSPNKLARWRRIAGEAAKQSGRSVVPEVGEPMSIKQLELLSSSQPDQPDSDALKSNSLGLVAHPYASRSLADVLANHPLPEYATLSFVTGPEGGFSDNELDDLSARGFHAISLGARILRAETAPVALAAALLLPEGR
jgi:16S rRNA (uracil1498-N3)-methyltransferase